MKEEINYFLEEYTNNYTKLFIETFKIRALSEFPKEELYDMMKKAIVMLNEKINEEIEKITDN